MCRNAMYICVKWGSSGRYRIKVGKFYGEGEMAVIKFPQKGIVIRNLTRRLRGRVDTHRAKLTTSGQTVDESVSLCVIEYSVNLIGPICSNGNVNYMCKVNISTHC